MRCPDTTVFASSRRPLTHALGHSQWPEPPRFVDASETSPAAVEEPLPLRDPTADRYGRVDAVARDALIWTSRRFLDNAHIRAYTAIYKCHMGHGQDEQN